MLKDSRSSSQNAVDQRSWDGKVNRRTYHSPIGSWEKRFPRLRDAGCNDSLCIEESSQIARALPKKSKCRRAACSEIRSFLERKTNCVHDLWTFSCNWSQWCSTRTLRFVQCTLTEWRRPRFRRSMGSVRWRWNIRKREILTLLFRRSFRSLNPNDCNYKRRINGLIRLTEMKYACMENWKWGKDSSEKINEKDWQEIEELRRTGCEETDRARRARIDGLSHASLRGILRLWVNCWLIFRNNRKTK